MINKSFTQARLIRPLSCVAFMLLGLSWGQLASAGSITINVEESVTDATGTSVDPFTGGFRYLVEEDHTWQPLLGTTVDHTTTTSLSFEFHKSHNPVAVDTNGNGLSGQEDGASVTLDNVPPGRYFVSVLPLEGTTLGGGSVTVGESGPEASASTVVRVNRLPIPTAQISIWLFEDNNPVNGALDIDERRLTASDFQTQGTDRTIPFTINLFDAAGQYGAAGGHVTQDAYGNPLGTKYIEPPVYDADGVPMVDGDLPGLGFVLHPDENGELIIKNLPPAKYGIQVVPPSGSGGEPLWVQTSTIEGSKTIDAWVKANEPETFVEFGPPGPHVFVGFSQMFDCINSASDAGCFDETVIDGDVVNVPVSIPGGNGVTISGTARNSHMSRPGSAASEIGFFPGESFPCMASLNQDFVGRTIVSGPCSGEDGADFEFTNVPAGDYSISIWDTGLNIVIASHTVRVGAAGPDAAPTQASCTVTNQSGCALGDLPVFDWFHFADTSVFYDKNENGYWDDDEDPLHADSSATLLRFRDGRVYNGLAIDFEGGAPLEEVFPFFHWLVAEVDFANYKATGATFTIDAGGNSTTLGEDGLVPQFQDVADCGTDVSLQPEVCSFDGGDTRTETGAVLTQGIQGFLGQKNVLQFGKTNYKPGENGGISGVMVYAITRAEDDPAYAAAEEWEPGIPRVQVALFDADPDTDTNADYVQPDVDNYPLDWAENGGAPGPEDVDRNGNGVFDMGDAIRVAWSDSWDDNTPEGCGGSNNLAPMADDKCFDGLRNFNQLRPAVFDGGYAFGGPAGEDELPSGFYVVQAYVPPGYELMREHHKNVDYGDTYAVPTLLPPACVGAAQLVPEFLAHSHGGGTEPAPYGGEMRPLCDARLIRVADGKNAAADFHMMTDVPKAAHVVGGVINDLGNEFNPNSPNFGEKYSPPWLPVAFYDYKGHEITRTYTDQFGKYNALLPSTHTVSIASPSGVAPNMVTACMNDAGNDDPWHNPQYSQFCYTFQYMPGGTTYLDTPVQQIAAFAGAGNQLDCDLADSTPMVAHVGTSSHPQGPFLAGDNGGDLIIRSAGLQMVPNPETDALAPTNLIPRDYGFGGTPGVVKLIRRSDQTEFVLSTSWTDGEIIAAVPAGIVGNPSGADDYEQFQLVVEDDDGNASPMGLTVTVGTLRGGRGPFTVFPAGTNGGTSETPIQDMIDNVPYGSLILLSEGTYNEIPIMWKPLHIQGAGAGSTKINAISVPMEKVEAWHNRVNALFNAGNIQLIAGQELPLTTEGGAGMSVFGSSNGDNRFGIDSDRRRRSSVDGIVVTGASTGGGIFVNGRANGFRASNNKIHGNQGTFGGGIRMGHYLLTERLDDPENPAGPIVLGYPDSRNDNIEIHNNMVVKNGNINGAGGGISIYNGADNYRVTNNLICGNFASTDGAGIGHLGLSRNGLIEDNQILFNQSFRQTANTETDGGGVLIAGNLPLNPDELTDGSGTVTLNRNLIQGNQAGAGDGGGVALRRVNGMDIANEENRGGDGNHRSGRWYDVRVYNNMIVNNVAGTAGGGISLLDATSVDIRSNTIANNQSTATAEDAFTGGNTVPVGTSIPQVAGVVSRGHSTGLQAEIDGITRNFNGNARRQSSFSNPILHDNVIWHNASSFHQFVDPATATDLARISELVFDGYDDLGVVSSNAGDRLDPRRSLLTDLNEDGNPAYHGTNVEYDGADPVFLSGYANGSPTGATQPSPVEFTTLPVAPALDEGGSWLDVRYGPLSINVDVSNNCGGVGEVFCASDYHLHGDAIIALDAINRGNNQPLLTQTDIDGDARAYSGSTLSDIGADEVD